MPFAQPAVAGATQEAQPLVSLDALEHEQLSVAARYAVLSGDEQGARAAVPHGRLELWEKQFLTPSRNAAHADAQAHIKRHEADAYERAKGKEAARRRLLEEEAAVRGHLSSRILTYEQMCELEPPEPLIPNVVYTGAVAVIIGDSQVGKSWVMLSIAAAAATGSPWPTGGGDTARRTPLPVLYVAAEDGGIIRDRFQKWENANGRSLASHAATLHLYPGAINLLDDVQIDELCAAVADRGYRLVVFDTVAASLGGEEEGNPQFSKVVQNMRRVVTATDGHGAVFLVHHTGKDASRGARGGSALFNDSDVFWTLRGTNEAMQMVNGPAPDGKWKAGRKRHAWRLRLDESDEAAVCVKADMSPASISAGAPRDGYAELKAKILHIVTARTDPKTAIGPTRQLIHGDLKSAGVQFRDSELTPAIEQLVADGMIVGCTGARSGERGRPPKYCYRPAPTQPELPSA